MNLRGRRALTATTAGIWDQLQSRKPTDVKSVHGVVILEYQLDVFTCDGHSLCGLYSAVRQTLSIIVTDVLAGKGVLMFNIVEL